MDSPLGNLLLSASTRGLCQIRFQAKGMSAISSNSSCAILDQAQEELSAYFLEGLQQFGVPLDWTGTRFQEQVWQSVKEIPFGKTTSYAGIALAIGRPRSARPVGGALGRNPIPIIVPCHRVISSSGALTGFASGLERKIKLLDLESRFANCIRSGV